MTIHVWRRVLKDVFSNPFMIIIPIFVAMILSITLPVLSSSTKSEEEFWLIFPLAMMPMILIVIIIPHMLGGGSGNVRNIIRIGNIEKRMEKLKKLGTARFIQETRATLVDSSARGNKLYSSRDIIPNKTVKFLIYSDKSTSREYISFVRNRYSDADQAMASKFNLSSIEYSKLKVENEAWEAM